MTCEHLRALEQALLDAGFEPTFRGQAWSENCREWVYFDCYLPAKQIREAFAFSPVVEDHEHFGTHDGQESGFVCTLHHDGVMGHNPNSSIAAPNFYPKRR